MNKPWRVPLERAALCVLGEPDLELLTYLLGDTPGEDELDRAMKDCAEGLVRQEELLAGCLTHPERFHRADGTIDRDAVTVWATWFDYNGPLLWPMADFDPYYEKYAPTPA